MTASLKHKQNEWTENVCANHAREMLFFEEIYTAGKKTTLPPVPVLTNLISVLKWGGQNFLSSLL